MLIYAKDQAVRKKMSYAQINQWHKLKLYNFFLSAFIVLQRSLRLRNGFIENEEIGEKIVFAS